MRDDQDLRREVEHREDEVEVRRLAEPADVQPAEQRDHDQATDHVARRVRQRRPERAQVVRHEEGRDRDREDVVEAERPPGDERHELVERVPREARGAARLGEHRRSLGVRLGGEREQPPREHEHDRREPERVGRHQAERVVDRRTHVAVGGREQTAHPDAAAQPVGLNSSHRPSSTVGGASSRGR